MEVGAAGVQILLQHAAASAEPAAGIAERNSGYFARSWAMVCNWAGRSAAGHQDRERVAVVIDDYECVISGDVADRAEYLVLARNAVILVS